LETLETLCSKSSQNVASSYETLVEKSLLASFFQQEVVSFGPFWMFFVNLVSEPLICDLTSSVDLEINIALILVSGWC